MHHLLRNVHLLLGLSLLAMPALHAEEKTEKEAAKAQPKLIGLWESTEKDVHIEFIKDGTFNLIPTDDISSKGSWKQKPESKDLDVVMDKDGEKMEAVMKVKFDGEDKVTLTVDDEPKSFARVKGGLDPAKFLGTWKTTDKDDEIGSISHYIVIRQKGGKGTLKTMEALKKPQIHYFLEETYEWRIVGHCLIETYDKGTPDESITVYQAKIQGPDEVELETGGEFGMSFEENRTKEAKLPDPPKGSKKVSEDDYWEALDKIFEEKEEKEVVTS